MRRSIPQYLSPLPRRSARRAKRNKKTRQGGRDGRERDMQKKNSMSSDHYTSRQSCVAACQLQGAVVYVRFLCGNTQMLREREREREKSDNGDSVTVSIRNDHDTALLRVETPEIRNGEFSRLVDHTIRRMDFKPVCSPYPGKTRMQKFRVNRNEPDSGTTRRARPIFIRFFLFFFFFFSFFLVARCASPPA